MSMADKNFSVIIYLAYCEAQVRVRQGSARDGPQGERPQSFNPCQELTLKLVATHHHHHHPPPTMKLNFHHKEPQINL